MKILGLRLFAAFVMYWSASKIAHKSGLDQWAHVPGQFFTHVNDVLSGAR